MLGRKDAIATVAVRDLDVARKFYEGTLGLTPAAAKNEPGTITYKSGASALLVYKSAYAGTNRATAVTWPVGEEIENIVRTLRAKNVTFEHYDLPGLTLEGDLHVATGSAKGFRVAWLKDPDGNIHSLVSD